MFNTLINVKFNTCEKSWRYGTINLYYKKRLRKDLILSFAFLIYFIFYSIIFEIIHTFFVTLKGRSELRWLSTVLTVCTPEEG